MGQQGSHCQDGRCEEGQCSRGPDVLVQLISSNSLYGTGSKPISTNKEGPVYHGSLDASCLKEGHGTLMLPDGSWYDGQFRKDKKSGQGVYHYRMGSSYRGQWLDDLQHGQGTECWADGSTFEGQFAKGKKHGHGCFKWKNGCTYEGQFNRNDMHGIGSYSFADGQEYSGQWILNSMGPNGKMSWPDGRVYEGEFSGGQKHGTGKLSWPDGRCYDGQWASDRQHGRGLAKTGHGEMSSSLWENGNFVRWTLQRVDRLTNEHQDVETCLKNMVVEEAAQENTRAQMLKLLSPRRCSTRSALAMVAETAEESRSARAQAHALLANDQTSYFGAEAFVSFNCDELAEPTPSELPRHKDCAVQDNVEVEEKVPKVLPPGQGNFEREYSPLSELQV